ncbi:hypothetical protein BZG36_01660 [Bifiguratus adelaidae]|uniref:Sulfhydryl oxidase n=1 Tax=Bifiguratus adelaidae TaxID=1938954 RepID=A0A261Y4A9_9FUNG|nr:hypothetical protein BZG36_01660 [Bifiguratus adelaidae]
MAQEQTQHATTVDPVTGKTVILKDGKPCRTCMDMKTWSRLTKSAKKSKTSQKDEQPQPTSDTKTESTSSTLVTAKTAAGLTAAASVLTSASGPNDCPVDSEQLGQATWTFLHTMAAYYPERPSPSQMESMRTFLSTFSQFYPCWYCADAFREDMEINPPQVASRRKLSQWLCERHNVVNVRLGKGVFDCAKVDERWRDGPADGRCD